MGDQPSGNLVALRTGEQTELFVRLFSATMHSLDAFILSLAPNLNEAEEIFQETNLILWKKFGQFDPKTDFRKWAFQVAYLEVLKWRRRHFKDKARLAEDVLHQLATEAIDTDELPDVRQDALMACLETLSPGDRTLIQMRYQVDESVRTVAERVGRSVDAVYKSINRIRWKLMDCVRSRLRLEEHA